MKHEPPPFTAERLDIVLEASARRSKDRIIWTLPAIGARVGRGREFAAQLAQAENTPIKRRGRQFYAFEDDLLAYMRRP